MTFLSECARILEFIGKSSITLLPYLAISIVMAAAIHQLNVSKKIIAFLKTNTTSLIFIATVFGAISPLCACGVIPMIFTLFQIGVPLAPIMSFWITSPVMSPSAFLLTWGNIGMEMAVVRLFSTITMGILAGYITLRLFPSDKTSASWLKYSPAGESGNCACNTHLSSQSFQERNLGSIKWKKFFADMKKMSLFLGSWLLVAFLLEAVIIFYLPMDFVGKLFGGQNTVSILLAALAGIPLYINNVSAIPIVDGLLQSGMCKGAALTLLLAGPVTTIPAMVAVSGLVKRKVFITFLALGFALSVMLGYLYEMANRILSIL